MEKQKTLELVIELLGGACSYPVDRMQPTTRLREDLGIGSLELLEVALALEERLGVPMPEGELTADVKTIGDLVDKAHGHVAEQENA